MRGEGHPDAWVRRGVRSAARGDPTKVPMRARASRRACAVFDLATRGGASYEKGPAMSYSSRTAEPKWQARWAAENAFATDDDPSKPKAYVLDMFPYPSGAGLHVGHCEGYTATDVIARYKRARGFRVLHPMGWDAFGLPAENYAIKHGVHPAKVTAEAVANFKRQINALGLSYDWSREVNTTDPKYYRWTQWIFVQLF